MTKAPKWTPGYDDLFQKADLCFLHQRVFDPTTGQLAHLNPLLPQEIAGKDVSFLGPYVIFIFRNIVEENGLIYEIFRSDIEQHIAFGIATGDIDPITKTPFDPTYIAKCDSAIDVRLIAS